MTGSDKPNESEVARRQAAAERLRGLFADVALGESLVDELIAERRAEARAEDREDGARRDRSNGSTKPTDRSDGSPFSLIGAFESGRSGLSARASRDEFEPRPFR